jgi:anti-sigma regulatory factor (Ser/Thr protein kinase)
VGIEPSAHWSYAATRRAPGDGRRAVGEFAASAGATARALGAIGVCVSEAMTNVVVHAYRHDDRPGSIELEVELEGDVLCVRVRDHGRGLEPRLDSPGLGLGIPLMAQLSAGLEILVAEDGGTDVTMRFDLREDEDADA